MKPLRKIQAALVAIAVAVAVAGAAVINTESGGQPEKLTIAAEFTDASPLVVGNDVKIKGVTVGEVADMGVRDAKAIVTLKIDGMALPLHKDARATVRPVSLLGERYVDLERGTASAPLLNDGDVLPVAQTGQATDLDQVLNTIDEPTGQSLAALVTMLGQGMQGNGANARASIKALASSMRDTDGLIKILGQQNQLLTDLVDNVQPVASALAADNGKTLDGLVDSSRQVLDVTANNQQGLDASLAELPSTLAAARDTLAELTGTAKATTPVLAGMRPTTENLSAISDELRKFSESADPALTSAKPVLERAEQLMDAARPVVEELRKAGPGLRGTVAGAKPLTVQLTDNIENVLNFFRFWAMSTNGWDGLSHYFRGQAIIHPEEITGLLPSLTGTPPPPTTPGADKPPASSPLPELPDSVGSSGLLDPKSLVAPDGGVTGLNERQESGVLDFLLGGS
ncbi:phospholipid/cholesterol/gamma-HCH transport system substrate-binding protein [Amycolatopsis marina]|uniref:Phospholipid/cholesterol/gamma-HCH transport system substrate-binding protein n=1 Tax=Amycolatopsis marina TaxID=490629 RepID=A0A1I1BST8_9PSEU|nr:MULTISPECIES: MlaD family protein [Amycolatopsis]SFB53465.1 phospholipid/cholesterol/gamma-HCH transport system substrate-binding protein [Amycolatopsis marina]